MECLRKIVVKHTDRISGKIPHLYTRGYPNHLCIYITLKLPMFQSIIDHLWGNHVFMTGNLTASIMYNSN